MAPRRLLALMIGLLLFSSVITALLPSGKRDSLDTTDPTNGSQLPVPQLPKDGILLRETIRAGSGKRPVIDANVGDQLALTVTGREPSTIELQGLGATADVDPDAPARFNVSLLDTGTFAIRELGTGRRVGEIRVTSRESRNPEKGGRSNRGQTTNQGGTEQA